MTTGLLTATSCSFGFYLCALGLQVRFLTTSTLVFAKLDTVLHAVGFEKRLKAAHMEKLKLEKAAVQKVSLGREMRDRWPSRNEESSNHKSLQLPVVALRKDNFQPAISLIFFFQF